MNLRPLIIIFIFALKQGVAQNWQAIPCFFSYYNVRTMFVDSLHDELILNFVSDHNICNTTFKGAIAFNGNNFQALDIGMNTHDNSNLNTSGNAFGCITYGNKTLFGGLFKSVGSNTLQSVGLALWNNSAWDTFPKKAFNYDPNPNVSGKSIYGFHKLWSKLWIYGSFDMLGGIPGKNLYTYDGISFQYVNIPLNNNTLVRKVVTYQNKLFVAGGIYNFPFDNYRRIIAYDGTNWLNVGNGVQTSLGGIYDMIVYKDTLYIAGSFNKADGNAGNNIMKWDGTSLTDAGFGGFYGWGGINQLLVFNNRLYAFGNFDYAADKKAFKAAYYENGEWFPNKDSIDNAILNAVIYKNEIYISGGFSSIGGDTSKKYFAKVRCPAFNCTVDLKENSLKENILIYPNPASNELIIELNYNSEKTYNVVVYSSIGQFIEEFILTSTKNKINTSSWAPGLYILNLSGNNVNSNYKIIKN